MITPSRFQVPPRPIGASHNVIGGPPAASIFLSFPSAKNPRKRLSGDQNGWKAPSVPASCCAESASRGRTQRRFLPSEADATKARRRPSGETVTGPALRPTKLKIDFSAGRMNERTAGVVRGGGWIEAMTKGSAGSKRSAVIVMKPRRLRFGRRGARASAWVLAAPDNAADCASSRDPDVADKTSSAKQ